MRWLRFVSAATLVAAYLVPPNGAFALPGQTLSQFQTWTAGRILLRGVNRTKDELSGRPAFELLTADHGIVWHFHATTDGRTIDSETLGVGQGTGEPGSTPIRHDGTGYGMVFVRSLYGDVVVADFLKASHLASITDRRSHVLTAFYHGRRYGYEIAAGTLTIAMHSRVAADLALLRQCNATPDSCNE